MIQRIGPDTEDGRRGFVEWARNHWKNVEVRDEPPRIWDPDEPGWAFVATIALTTNEEGREVETAMMTTGEELGIHEWAWTGGERGVYLTDALQEYANWRRWHEAVR